VPQQYLLVSGQTRLFTLTVPLPFTGLHVACTSAYGAANLFVSVQPTGGARVVPAPGRADFEAASIMAVENLNIYPSDAAVARACVRGSVRGAAACTFTVGVQSMGDASVWLMVSLDGEGWLRSRLRVPPPPPPSSPFKRGRRVLFLPPPPPRTCEKLHLHRPSLSHPHPPPPLLTLQARSA
jgi:hypothetical protein